MELMTEGKDVLQKMTFEVLAAVTMKITVLEI